jgi:dephospho-CoA kinase
VRTIALTGGIASGKSTVAAMLARRGAAIVDADQVAREVVEPGRPALAEIAAAFGPGVLGADGSLDRETLSNIVFADADARRRLEAITHPRVRTRMAELAAEALQSSPPLLVLDIPLLFESAMDRDFPEVLLAYVPTDVQLARLQIRNGLNREQAEQRLQAQDPIEDKRARSTWVIDNSGTVEQTQAEVDRWWQREVSGVQ